MDDVLAGLRAAGESTRLRLLHILTRGELNVTELTQILRQSQPRLSRHLKLMVDAGLLERYREGSWVLFRAVDTGPMADLVKSVVKLLPHEEQVLVADRAELQNVLRRRAEIAEAYFSENAANWDTIRSLHAPDDIVEEAVLELVGEAAPELLIDLGTGTGQILDLLAPKAKSAVGIDLSREMLAIARAKLERAGLRQAQVRHGDLFALPFEDQSADLITVHQVLHYIDDYTGAIMEAARILTRDGRLLIVDFAPHELEFLREQNAHRRLGFSNEQMRDAFQKAGLELRDFRKLEPAHGTGPQKLTVCLWLASPANARITSSPV